MPASGKILDESHLGLGGLKNSSGRSQLDQFNIERDNAKGDPLNLASRIEKLTKTKPDQADYLNALRWLGNAGSHDGIVEFDDLLSCFDMLEHAMIELFEGREEKRRAEAKRIFAAKGKPAR